MATDNESPQAKTPTSNLPPQPPVSLSHHQRRCTVCRHPERHWIEQDFLHWRSPYEISDHYQLSDRAVVYRHAHAFGLFDLRKRKLRSSLEFVIERAEYVEPTASGLVCAIRAYTCITDDGQWIEPPRRSIITHETISKVVSPDAPGDVQATIAACIEPSGRTCAKGCECPPGVPESNAPQADELIDQSTPGNESAAPRPEQGFLPGFPPPQIATQNQTANFSTH